MATDLQTMKDLRSAAKLDVVVMTRGADGALVVTADEVVDHPGVPATVIDTVGAGDSFAARFVLGLLKGEPWEQTVREACQVAAEVCSHQGAVPEILTSSFGA